MDLRVLVVCPDPDSANLLRTVLAEMEIVAEHSPSISSGLERLHDQTYDAVILDYRADQSSEDFLAKLRQVRTPTRNTLLIAILDADAVKRTLDELSAEERKRRTVDPQAAVDALLAGKRVERMAGGPAAARYDRVVDSWNPGVVDLVAEALDAFMHFD